MPILTSAFHLVFGRRGPRTRAPAPPPAAPPPPAPAPAPAAAAPPPPPAPAVPPAPVEPPPPPAADAAAPPPAAAETPTPSPAPAETAPPPADTASPAAEATIQPQAETPPATEATSPPPAQQPAAEQPVTEQPAAEQPAAEQPAAERPAAEQPATAPSEPTPPAQPEVRPDVVAPAPSDALQLSPHFHLREFIASDTARERGLDNSPDAHDLETLKRTAQLMEKVRTLLGNKSIHINSCYRNEQVNRAVGGVANSAHRLGHAVDFTCAAFGTPYQIVEFLKTQDDLMADVDQLIFERNVWVHISFEPRNPCRKQVLTAHRVRGQTTLGYVPGLVQLDADGYLVSA